MNIELIRSLFPVAKKIIYFNSASQSPLSTLVNGRLQTHLEIEFNPIGKEGFNRDSTRLLLSKLLGGLPQEYALVTSTGVGIGIVAQGLNLKKGDNVVLPEREHWNNTFPWLQLQKRGVEVRFAKLNEDNSISAQAIEELIDHNTRVLAIAAVRFNSGFRTNLAVIGKMAHEKGALFVVDAAQAAGMVPINIEKYGIDVMAGCGFKWLLGMHGTGFLYVSKKASKIIDPVLAGMFAAVNHFDKLYYYDDSRKYETGTLAYPLFDSWNAGLELLLEIGVENIYAAALENTDFLLEGLCAKESYKIATPTKNREERTAIVHFNAGSLEATQKLYQKLLDNKIVTTLQAENIRVSPNFYNTKEEIKMLLDLL